MIGALAVMSTPISFEAMLPCLLLYGAAVFWTFGYDTVYATQDIDDDARIGVKSSALKFGARSFDFILAFYIIMAVCLLFALLLLQVGMLGWGFYSAAMGHVLWNHYRWNPADPACSLARFKSHIVSGALIAMMFVV